MQKKKKERKEREGEKQEAYIYHSSIIIQI